MTGSILGVGVFFKIQIDKDEENRRESDCSRNVKTARQMQKWELPLLTQGLPPESAGRRQAEESSSPFRRGRCIRC